MAGEARAGDLGHRMSCDQACDQGAPGGPAPTWQIFALRLNKTR